MELSIGMYVRLDRCQGIAKIEKFDDENNCYILDKMIGDDFGNETYILNKDDIIGEPSYNIIDLIEIGDYVNGHRVTLIEDGVIYTNDTRELILADNIESVVTQDQFEGIAYWVGD